MRKAPPPSEEAIELWNWYCLHRALIALHPLGSSNNLVDFLRRETATNHKWSLLKSIAELIFHKWGKSGNNLFTAGGQHQMSHLCFRGDISLPSFTRIKEFFLYLPASPTDIQNDCQSQRPGQTHPYNSSQAKTVRADRPAQNVLEAPPFPDQAIELSMPAIARSQASILFRSNDSIVAGLDAGWLSIMERDCSLHCRSTRQEAIHKKDFLLQMEEMLQ